MALNPRFAGHRIGKVGGHTVEVYVDYVCPWSTIMIDKLYKVIPLLIERWLKGVFPTLEKDYPTVSFIFRHQVQPWHPSSTMTHESALAVERVDQSKFWDYSIALFAKQTGYFDSSSATESRLDMYKRLAKLAEDSVGVSAEEVLKYLYLEPVAIGSAEGHNIGNAVYSYLSSWLIIGYWRLEASYEA
jgi:protein-disulfide isomerase